MVLRTKFVFVLGILKINPPSSGSSVKLSLYQDGEVSYTASNSSALCGEGCNLGSKVIAVLGGKCES